MASKLGAATEEKWIRFFRHPEHWWDWRSKPLTANLKSRIRANSPDFKHARTGERIWIESCPRELRHKLSHLEFPTPGCRAQYGHLHPVDRMNMSKILDSLQLCSSTRNLQEGKRVHREAVTVGCSGEKRVAKALIKLYSKCRETRLARAVFDRMVERDAAAWRELILGYVKSGEFFSALEIFNRPDCEACPSSYAALLLGCGTTARARESEQVFCLRTGMAIHKRAIDAEFDSTMTVGTALVDMYRKCGRMEKAREVFDRMKQRNVAAWTSLLLGYVEIGECSTAMDLFDRIDCEPDGRLFAACLKACCSPGVESLQRGERVHRLAKLRGIDSKFVVASSLVEMYSKHGLMKRAKKIFLMMNHWDVGTWNALILGYVEGGEFSKALKLLDRMDCRPNSFTFIAALGALGGVGETEAGRGIHAQICRLGLEHLKPVANALVGFYRGCGRAIVAQELLYCMQDPDANAFDLCTRV